MLGEIYLYFVSSKVYLLFLVARFQVVLGRKHEGSLEGVCPS